LPGFSESFGDKIASTFSEEEIMKGRTAGLLALGLASPLFAALMLHTETTIPKPISDETAILNGLVYKATFVAKVESVRLDVASEAGADPIIAEWVFSGSNTDGQVHRLDMQVRLLDEKGKQIGVFSARHPLSAGAKNESFSVGMKVKSSAWDATKKIQIWANWTT
jgi:hypothetical protein